MVRKLANQFLKGIFYLNLWPFNKTLMVVANPYTAAQVEAAFLNKPRAMTDTMEVIMGGPSLMTMHGGTWKKSVISLVLDEYLKDVGNTEELSRKAFKKLVIPQLRLFLYAGHDTTSSTLLYCYYLLFKHPDILERVRNEHDAVFGSEFSVENVQLEITKGPTQLNKLQYTQAVIKEVLRLFPPGASIRDGRSDLILTDEDGKQFPTDGCHIWSLNLVMHHSPEIFASPEEFIPDRWLVEPHDPLCPKKGSWRAFEWGPRACIGQTLAQLELKVVLVMTLRMFDVKLAYTEWDEKHGNEGITTVDGNRVYQAEMGGAGSHPVDGFPVRITLRK
ncbi:hypothetical protein KJ359_010533 [Pestalotiopsis sp. 9143b]|nr:hypothetical protein KJ359_010533 [Pestalotiopsis sp. 9143b]